MTAIENISDLMPQMLVPIGTSQIISATGPLFDHVEQSGPMWDGDGDRAIRGRFVFTKAFVRTPLVTAYIVGLDSDHSTNLRYWLNVTDVGPLAFTLEFKTWGNTRIARAGVSWSAVGR